jgi:hypothetical protein
VQGYHSRLYGRIAPGLDIGKFSSAKQGMKTTLNLSDTAYGAIFLPQVALTAAGAVAGGLLTKRLGLPVLLRLSLLANGLSQLALLISAGMGGSSGFVLVALGTAFCGESLFLRKLFWACLPNKRQKSRDR